MMTITIKSKIGWKCANQNRNEEKRGPSSMCSAFVQVTYALVYHYWMADYGTDKVGKL